MSLIKLDSFSTLKNFPCFRKNLLLWANYINYQHNMYTMVKSARMEPFWGYPETKPRMFLHFIWRCR